MRDKAERFALDCVPRYTDYHEMLERERPELVAIATESGKHAAIALDCIDFGCNLIIEKPIALSLEDADAIIRSAGEKLLLRKVERNVGAGRRRPEEPVHP